MTTITITDRELKELRWERDNWRRKHNDLFDMVIKAIRIKYTGMAPLRAELERLKALDR